MGWLEPIKVNYKANVRIVCCHHSGGGASIFYPWRHLVLPSVELLAVQLPGRETRLYEPLLTNMETVVEQLFNKFKSLLDKPLLLFGHSMGGLIAFELSKKLQEFSSPLLNTLIVSGCKAPHLPILQEFHMLTNEALVSKLIEYNGTPKEVLEDQILLDLLLPTLRADFTVGETYQFRETAPLTCNIIALGGLQDKWVKINELKSWERHTNTQFKFYTFSGDHFFIKSAENEIKIVNILNKIAEGLS